MMQLPHGLRIGLACALIIFALLCIPETIINYINIKEIWVVFVGSFAGFLALFCSLFLLIFVKDKGNVIVEEEEVVVQPKVTKTKAPKQRKQKETFISEEEWEELDEEEEELDYIDED